MLPEFNDVSDSRSVFDLKFTEALPLSLISWKESGPLIHACQKRLSRESSMTNRQVFSTNSRHERWSKSRVSSSPGLVPGRFIRLSCSTRDCALTALAAHARVYAPILNALAVHKSISMHMLPMPVPLLVMLTPVPMLMIHAHAKLSDSPMLHPQHAA